MFGICSRYKDGLNYMCKGCWRIYQFKWRKTPGGQKSSRAHYRKYASKPEIKEVRKWSSIKRKFGITKDQWENIFISQNKSCGICLKKEPDHLRDWAVDHDHNTGAIRGILCQKCNILLGAADDSIKILTSAIKYLNRNGIANV